MSFSHIFLARLGEGNPNRWGCSRLRRCYDGGLRVVWVRPMSKLRDAFCDSIKERYPAISKKADAEYELLWGDFTDSEYYSYSWFEALAHALNKEMSRRVPVSQYQELLYLISSSFESGDEDVRKCIDVAFVENLFWQVSRDKAVDYWGALPENLKSLFIGFHHINPL